MNVNKTESLHKLTEPHTDNSHYMLYAYIYLCNSYSHSFLFRYSKPMQFMLFTCLYHIQYSTCCSHIAISCKSNAMQYLFVLLFLYILVHIFLFFCPCPLSHVCPNHTSESIILVQHTVQSNPNSVIQSIIYYNFGSSYKSSHSNRSMAISTQSYQSSTICSIISDRSILSTSYGQSGKENNSIS